MSPLLYTERERFAAKGVHRHPTPAQRGEAQHWIAPVAPARWGDDDSEPAEDTRFGAVAGTLLLLAVGLLLIWGLLSPAS